MNKDKLVEQMLKEKGDVNNTIDLDAYARGLIDMFDYIEKQEQELPIHSVVGSAITTAELDKMENKIDKLLDDE